MSKKIAYGGILLAINIILLLLVNIIPINTLFIMGLSSLPLSIIIMEFGFKHGIVFYIGSAILSFFVMTNKIQWAGYASTFGIYGLIKYAIERDRLLYIEIILKLLFANIIMYLLINLLRSFIVVPINILSISIFQVIFLMYDYMYSHFINYYINVIRKIMPK